MLVHFRSVRNLVENYRRRYPLRFLWIVLAACLAVWGMYSAILAGFNFLIGLGGFGKIIIKRLFYVLFFIVFVMVGMSFGLLFYAVSFRSRETDYLFTMPIKTSRVAFFKFCEAMLFASWIPCVTLLLFALAYARINQSPVWFVLAAPLYCFLLVLAACGTSWFISASALRFLDPKKTLILMGLFLAALALTVKKHVNQEETRTVFYLLSDEIVFFKLAKAWFFPFSWAASGLLALDDENPWRSGLFLVNLLSLAGFMVTWLYANSARLFTRLYFKYSVPRHKHFYRPGLLDKLFSGRLMGRDPGNLLLKDVKLFIREPALWMQFLVFFGLLFFYFVLFWRIDMFKRIL